jgi:hypothetical protein
VLSPQGQESVSEIRLALENGVDPSTVGAASLLPSSFPMTPTPVLERTFGQGFHAAIADLPIGTWEGPVKSGFGQHLVRVSDRSEAVLPPLSAIRDRVETEWRAGKIQEFRESFGQALLERYSVTLPDAGEVLGQ